MKLTKEEKAKVKEMIKFENGILTNQETLEKNLIDFINKKYREKYKEPEHEDDEKNRKFINIFKTNVMVEGEEVEFKDRAVMEDNEFIERTSVLLYQESVTDRRKRGIKVKNESFNIEPIGTKDIGQKRQYEPFFTMNGQKIYVDKVSSDDYSETSTVQFQIGNVYAKDYNEREHAADEAINKIFKYYYSSDNQNEILYSLLVNLNKFGSFTWENYEALIFLLNIELIKYKPTNNQISIINKIFAGKIPNANERKSLKRMLNI